MIKIFKTNTVTKLLIVFVFILPFFLNSMKIGRNSDKKSHSKNKNSAYTSIKKTQKKLLVGVSNNSQEYESYVTNLNWFALTVFNVKKWEGLRLKTYKCPAGYNTKGWGYNLDAHKKDGSVIKNVSDANKIFLEVFSKYVNETRDSFPNLSRYQVLALSSVAYNIKGGVRRLMKTKAGIAARKGKKDITKELMMLTYYKDPKKGRYVRALGLERRRMTEAYIYKGDVLFYHNNFNPLRNLIIKKIVKNKGV